MASVSGATDSRGQCHIAQRCAVRGGVDTLARARLAKWAFLSRVFYMQGGGDTPQPEGSSQVAKEFGVPSDSVRGPQPHRGMVLLPEIISEIISEIIYSISCRIKSRCQGAMLMLSKEPQTGHPQTCLCFGIIKPAPSL